MFKEITKENIIEVLTTHGGSLSSTLWQSYYSKDAVKVLSWLEALGVVDRNNERHRRELSCSVWNACQAVRAAKAPLPHRKISLPGRRKGKPYAVENQHVFWEVVYCPDDRQAHRPLFDRGARFRTEDVKPIKSDSSPDDWPNGIRFHRVQTATRTHKAERREFLWYYGRLYDVQKLERMED